MKIKEFANLLDEYIEKAFNRCILLETARGNGNMYTYDWCDVDFRNGNNTITVSFSESFRGESDYFYFSLTFEEFDMSDDEWDVYLDEIKGNIEIAAERLKQEERERLRLKKQQDKIQERIDDELLFNKLKKKLGK